MAQFETWLKSDLNSQPVIQTIKGNVFSSDNQGNLVGVEVYHDGEPVALVGTVSGYIIRDDGATVIVSGTVDGNRASIIMPEAAYACPGPIGIAIRLVNGTSRTVLGACRGIVYRTSTEHIVDPSHEIPNIDELLAQLGAIREATTAANTATGNANSAASSANNAAESANRAANSADAAASSANAAAMAANQAASGAEAWAVGERGGAPVGETDQTYHNNAKYYAEKTAEDRAATSQAEKAVAEGVSAAQEAETNAAESASDAEAWAVGERGGVPVNETDQTYHNNAKYYAVKTAEDRAATIQAEQAVAAKVMEGVAAAEQARGHEEAAEQAQEAAEAAAREAAETVVAAQGPGILYVDTEGIPYVLE